MNWIDFVMRGSEYFCPGLSDTLLNFAHKPRNALRTSALCCAVNPLNAISRIFACLFSRNEKQD